MPPRKKQKTARKTALACAESSSSSSTAAPSWKGTKRRRTSMEKFIDGPVDIVVEVLTLLHPRDLFTLVRTSSVFKNFLLSKDRLHLWKTVIANAADLPPQPPWLTEPAFVHLLYSNHCHNCGAAAKQAITEWFKRACPTCIPEVSVTWSDAWRQIRALGQVRGSEVYKIFDLIPNGKQRSYMNYNFYGSSEAYRCSNADLNGYLEQLRMIKMISDEKEREKAYQAIVQEWMQRLKHRQKYSAWLQGWFEKEERNRIAALDDKKAQRFALIIERLQESEWAKEIEFLSDEEVEDMSMLPVVRRSSKLTEREWTNVLAALDGFLNKTRERRLLTERHETIRARLGELEKAMLEHYVQLPRTAEMDIRPNYIEFALMNKCKALADAPVEQAVTCEDFLAILPELHKKWRTSSKTQLAKEVKKHLRVLNVSTTTRDPLNLAVAVFVCAHCCPFALMRHPAVLAHGCGYTNDDNCWEDLEEEQPTASELYAFTARTLHVDENDYAQRKARDRFSINKVVGPEDSYIREVLEPMCTIVRALGLDPATATAEDLEACDARLRCATCAAEGKLDLIYGWDAALLHFREFRNKNWHAKWQWKRVHGPEMDKVREVEAARDARSLDIHGSESVWACSLCTDWDGSGGEIVGHLLEQHQLKDANECVRNGTIYVHPAKNDVLMRLPVVIRSSV